MSLEKVPFGKVSATNWAAEHLVGWIRKNNVPIISSAIVSAFTYVFILTNKIVNWDELQFLFGKGYTLSSGRWGLDLLSYILPDYSMPWLWGMLSLVLLTISICYIINIFEIKSKILQGVLAGVIIAFPSEVGTMFYMFTSSSYAIAFLCSVLAVYYFEQEKIYHKIIALLLAVFSLSIYQAYIAVTASFFVLLAMKELLVGEHKTKDIIKSGVQHILFLGIALAVYYGITYSLLWIDGSSLNGWAQRATSDSGSIVYRAMRSWKLFAAMLLLKAYGLETTNLSMVAHIACGVCIGCMSLFLIWKEKRAERCCFCFYWLFACR